MSRKVLIVDDELDMRTFLSTLLATGGYDPIVAGDGLEGIQKARDIKPELIILDIMMPKESGIRMYQQLKTDDELKHIPVIMLSAIAKKTFLHSKGLLSVHPGQSLPEPEAFIEKPLEPDELFKLAKTLLSSQQ